MKTLLSGSSFQSEECSDVICPLLGVFLLVPLELLPAGSNLRERCGRCALLEELRNVLANEFADGVPLSCAKFLETSALRREFRLPDSFFFALLFAHPLQLGAEVLGRDRETTPRTYSAGEVGVKRGM